MTTKDNTSVPVTIEAHSNNMKGPAFDVQNPVNRLRIAAASCFFGEPSYYNGGKTKSDQRRFNMTSQMDESVMDYLVDLLKGVITPHEVSENSPAQVMEDAIDRALDHDFVKTLDVAISLRNDDYIRTTPQIILVRAAHHPSAKGNQYFGVAAKQIIRRADEPAVQAAYQLNVYGKTIPTRLKKVWAKFLEAQPEHVLAKYKMESRIVKTVDVVRLCHASSNKNPAIEKLIYGNLKLEEGRDTWESIISREGSDKATWLKAVPVMGHMALLRNLRNLLTHEVPTALYADKLVNGVIKGKQLPFRYYSAYQAVQEMPNNREVVAALESCMDLSVKNLPHFDGRVMALSDNSGSCHGTLMSTLGSTKMSTAGNIISLLTAMVADEGYVGVFGDKLSPVQANPNNSFFPQLKNIEQVARRVGAGTETGIWLFWDQAIRQKEHWDHVFVYSDMQAGHGGLYCNEQHKPSSNFVWKGRSRGWGGGNYVDVPALVAAYRKKVNPDVQVYLVQTAGYQDTIMPEVYEKTYILGGWSDGIIRFADKMNTLGALGKRAQ